jgi:hypothetical protein
MAANSFSALMLQDDREESGQSVLEFLFMIPLLIGLTIILYRSNLTVQMAIVNQQYARQHALWLTFNSPWYPERKWVKSEFVAKQTNRLITGVSENVAVVDGGGYEPEASKYRVTRSKKAAASGSSESKMEPDRRAEVRVRNTVALCTPSHVTSNGIEITPGSLKDPISSSVFAYCRSTINE